MLNNIQILLSSLSISKEDLIIALIAIHSPILFMIIALNLSKIFLSLGGLSFGNTVNADTIAIAAVNISLNIITCFLNGIESLPDSHFMLFLFSMKGDPFLILHARYPSLLPLSFDGLIFFLSLNLSDFPRLCPLTSLGAIPTTINFNVFLQILLIKRSSIFFLPDHKPSFFPFLGRFQKQRGIMSNSSSPI